jgi:hypothetical protein
MLMGRIQEAQERQRSQLNRAGARECTAVTGDEESQIIIKFIERDAGAKKARGIPIILRKKTTDANGQTTEAKKSDSYSDPNSDSDSDRQDESKAQETEHEAVKFRMFEGLGVSAPGTWLRGISDGVSAQGYELVSPLVGVDFTGKGLVPMVAFNCYGGVVVRMYGDEAYRYVFPCLCM